jgi:hypothetical protein
VYGVKRTKRERMIPGEGEVRWGRLPEASMKTSVSCRREEKKPISATSALVRSNVSEEGEGERERGIKREYTSSKK